MVISSNSLVYIKGKMFNESVSDSTSSIEKDIKGVNQKGQSEGVNQKRQAEGLNRTKTDNTMAKR